MSTTNGRGLILPTVGSDTSTWGGYLNNNFAYITQMFGTVLSVNVASGYALSTAETQNGTIQLTGTLTNNVDVTFPNVSGVWNIENRTVGNFYVRLKTATGNNATIGIPQGKTSQIFVDITSSYPGVKFLNPPDPGTYWDYASGTTPVWFTGCTSNTTTAQLPWLPCDGVTTYNFSDYPYLAAILVGTWGGNGVTTFKTPDLRNRARVSVFPSTPLLTSPLDGATVGAVSSASNVTIAQANLPAVTLTTTIAAGQGAHTHTIAYNLNVNQNFGTSGANQATSSGSTTTSSATLPTMTGTTPLGGSGTAIPTVQPTAIAGLTFIKT